MRRHPFLLIIVFFAAFFLAPVANAHRTQGEALSMPAGASHHKQRPLARASKHPRGRTRRAVAHLRPVVFHHRQPAQPALKNLEVESGADPSESQDHAPSVEIATLESKHRPTPSPLRGSLESLVRQNEKTEADGLERIEDDADLNDRIARKMLVPVPVSAALNVNQNLPENRRYCRPWTARFLTDLARAHAAAFHGPLEVSSAVRTVEYQKQLMRVNGNATAAEGDVASPHLTGATIDIAKTGHTRKEIAWMRAWLLPLQTAGKIDVEEEFRQACFHITVYKSYIPGAPSQKPASETAINEAKSNGAGL